MRKSNGITIIALVITIVITLVLATIVLEYGTTEIDNAKIEDIKAEMLLIKGRAKISVDKANFQENYQEAGVIKLGDNLSVPSEATLSYDLSNLRSVLNALENKSNLYIWEQQALDNNNIDITIDAESFYVIDYNTMEIYFSLGYEKDGNTYYSLTELQGL